MGAPGAGPDPAGTAPLPPDPVVDSFSGPPPVRQPRPVSGSKRTPRAHPRPAGGSSSTRMVARIAAPVVFLVAVIALISIVVQSGVMGSDGPTPTPTVNATKTKDGTTTAMTKKYVVQSGDSLSSIAVRFDTTTSVLKELNPELSGSTLAVGQRIVVPRK
jgi:LysM domain